MQKVVQNHPNSTDQILEENKNEKYENLMLNFFVNYLRGLNKRKKDRMMHDILNKIFEYQLNNKTFAEWLAIKWEINAPRFIKNVTSWRESQFQETRKEKAKRRLIKGKKSVTSG